MTTKKPRRWPVVIIVTVGLLVLLFLLGPKPQPPDFSSLVLHTYSSDLDVLEDSLVETEAYPPLKIDNSARIIWANPYKKTPYSMVYLHGNGASPEEGDPIHEALAHRYGCNLYLARLEGHGLVSENPLMDIDPVLWMQSALDAISMGKAIGEKVILISCSAGSTLALYLTSKYPDLVEAQIMLSPCIDFFDPRSFLIDGPWGLQISRLILDSKFYGWKAPGPAQQYWYTRYRIEGLVTLKLIIDKTMTKENFNKIEDPLFLSYYYQDDEHQDKVVSVNRMKEMFAQISTPVNLKKESVVSDAGTHIIGSDLFNSNIGSVWTPVTAFCEQVIHLTPVNDTDWKIFLDFRTSH